MEVFTGVTLIKFDRIQSLRTIQSEYQLAQTFIQRNVINLNGLLVVGPRRRAALVAESEREFPQGVRVGEVEACQAHFHSVSIQHLLQVRYLRCEPGT